MKSPRPIDTQALARQFDRRARTANKADFLHREIEQRMFERLELIKISPASLLDIGCGTGAGLLKLAGHFPQAALQGVDVSPARVALANGALQASLPKQSNLARWFALLQSKKAVPVTPAMLGDAHALPFAESSQDLLWSNLAFHWFADPIASIAEMKRVLRANGLVMLSAFGVDTCKEVAALGVELPTFQDMHDIGDALVNVGFTDPVVDTERLTLTYTSPNDLLADLRALGGNALASRKPGLFTPRAREVWLERLSGVTSLSIEVVYVHAWLSPSAKLPEGYSSIEFKRRS